MLNKGSTCEADLNALDKKLEGTIKKMREDKLAKSTNKLDGNTLNKLNNSGSLGRASNGFDAKSVAKSIHGSDKALPASGQRSNGFNGGKIVYEDPAAQLNISEGKWNEIVQANLKKFSEDKEKAIKDKFAKNKAIQDEQLKQIEMKKERQKAM